MTEKRKNLNDLISYIILTDEFKSFAGSHLPVLLNEWAGKNIFKKFVAKRIRKSIEKGFLSKRKYDLSSVYKEKEFIETVSKAVPELINLGIENISNFSNSLNDFTTDEQSLIFGNLIGKVNTKQAGKAVTNFAVTLTEIHKNEPEFLSRALQPGVRDFIEGVDFGELRDLIDSSNKDWHSIVKMINEEMWKYPSKMILLMSFIPSGLNIAVVGLQETLKQMNKVAPDLLSDALLSFFNDIDGEMAGELLNEVNEIIRKIETGSALIGEPGESSISTSLVSFIEKVMTRLNPEVFIKSRNSISRIKVLIEKALFNVMSSHPKLMKELFVSSFKNLNTDIALFSAKAEAFIEQFSNEEISEILINGINEIEAQEISEIINILLSNMNIVYSENSEIIKNFFINLFDSIDSYELETGIKKIIPDIVESIKPHSNIIMPPVINGITELLSPEEGPSENLKNSLNKFRTLIMDEEKIYE